MVITTCKIFVQEKNGKKFIVIEMILVTELNMGTGMVAAASKKMVHAMSPKHVEEWNIKKLPHHLN